MKNSTEKTHPRLWITLVTLCLLCFTSCDDHDGIALIDSSYRTLEFSSGGDVEIPVLVDNWYIESVQYMPSGEVMLDKDNRPLTLSDNGVLEASNGWLVLTRDTMDKFIVSMKENFDPVQERVFKITINNNGNRDYITITQRGGSEYKLVDQVLAEIEEDREIYTSDEECTSITLHNDTSEEVWEPTDYVFENVMIYSHFESDDYGAFSWMFDEVVNINAPELIVDGENYGRAVGEYMYQEGEVRTPYINDIPNGSKLLMQPNSTTRLSGEVTYCKRVFNFTLTVENTVTGTRFEVNGVWTQVAPLSSNLILF